MNIKIMGPSGVSKVDFLQPTNNNRKPQQDFRKNKKQEEPKQDFRSMLNNELNK